MALYRDVLLLLCRQNSLKAFTQFGYQLMYVHLKSIPLLLDTMLRCESVANWGFPNDVMYGPE